MNFSNFHKFYFVNLPSPYFHESLYHQILYCRKICEREFCNTIKTNKKSPETMKHSISKSSVYVSMGKTAMKRNKSSIKGWILSLI